MCENSKSRTTASAKNGGSANCNFDSIVPPPQCAKDCCAENRESVFVRVCKERGNESDRADMSRLANALLLLALALVVSAELADDFNIPKGWRMQVSSLLCFPQHNKLPTRRRLVGCWIRLAWRYPALPLLFTGGE